MYVDFFKDLKVTYSKITDLNKLNVTDLKSNNYRKLLLLQVKKTCFKVGVGVGFEKGIRDWRDTGKE